MKNVIAIVLTLMMALSLAACGCTATVETTAPTTRPATSPTTRPATAPTAEPSRPVNTVPSTEMTVPNTVGEDGFVHPTEENGEPVETTAPDMSEEFRRMMPGR